MSHRENLNEGNKVDFQNRLRQLEKENKELREEIENLHSIQRAYVEDIEEREENEKTYNKSQIRYRTIFEESKLGNKIIAPDLRIIKVNRALEELLGYNEEEMIGRTITDFAHPDSIPAWTALQSKLWKHEMSSFYIEAHLFKKDGSIVWCGVNTILFQDNNSSLGYSIIENIGKLKYLKERLVRSEFVDAESQEAVGMGSFFAEFNSGVVESSSSLNKIFGFPEQEMFIQKEAFFQRMLPEFLEKHTETLSNAIERGEPYAIEYKIIVENKEKWIWEKGNIRRDADTKIHIFGIVQDITEIKELELKNKNLLLRNDELDAFVYTASHDLLSPVNNMSALCNALSKEIIRSQGNENAQVYINLLNKSLTNLKNTIIDLTTVTEIHPGEKKELIDLNTIIEEVQFSLLKQIEETEARIILDLKIPFLTIPRNHAKSLFFNIMSNALKFHSPERRPMITISSFLKDNLVHIVFSDNGIWIREANQNKVFAIFKRFNPEISGRGVGMHLVKRVIDLNDGNIYLESKENVGTTFHIELPFDQ